MDLEKEFKNLGGQFIMPSEQISSSLSKIKAFIFDWDGVFNDGRKTNEKDSSFSEIDSMGINLLRFDYWLRNKRFPLIFIITGMKNQAAAGFAARECLEGIFQNTKNKSAALETICRENNLTPQEIGFFFDDVLDLELAKRCGLSFFVGRKSNPLLNDYVKQNKICSYISGSSGEDHAIREICELIIGLSGNYNRAVELRMQFKGEYEDYFNKRNSITTVTFTM